jgi:serine/threonine protein kinase
MPDGGLIGKTIDGYHVERLIGQGGMAAVYAASDPTLNRTVALKVMHSHLAAQSTFRDLFVQEAQHAASLDHPNIIKVYSVNTADNNLYMVMELIDGGNLRRYVKQLAEQGQFVDYPEAVEIVRQVAAAMHYAHERNMIHRDLKPDNIILKPLPPQSVGIPYQPIITDFGVAQLIEFGDEADTAAQPVGTYPYMSPEQVNARPVDRRTDVYAMGVILYELSLGRLPFNPRTIADAARMHGREPVPRPSDFQAEFPQPLEKILMRALAKRADDRYPTAAALAEDLTQFLRLGEQPRSRVSSFPLGASLSPTGTVEVESVEMDAPPDEDDFDTAIQTRVMTVPLPPAPSDTVQEPPRTPGQPAVDLLWLASEDDSFLYELSEIKDSYTIGREPDADIFLDGDAISRQHGRIERKPNGRYEYTDGGSTNGTHLENSRVAADESILLRDGDTLRMGEWWLTFRARVGEVSQRPPAAPVPAVDPDDADYSTDAGYAPPELVNEVPQATPQPVLEPEPVRSTGPKTELMGIAPPDAMPRQEPPRLSGEQLMMDRLTIYHRDETPRLLVLEQDSYTVGRAPENDIVLSGNFVSWFHATIERDVDGLVYIRPEETTNGTWYGQQALEPEVAHRLVARRVLRIGDYWITFEAGRGVGLDVMAVQRGVISRQEETYDDSIDTVAMVRPLRETMPEFQMPPMNEDLRASDRLVFYSEDQPLHIAPLDRETITVGRGSNQDIRLRGKRVSREHAVFELRPDGNIYITDNDSRNGVWVGDTLLVPQTQVLWARHEALRVGNYWVRFERASTTIATIGVRQDPRGLIGRVFGAYRIDRYIGSSAISATYKATDVQLERDVAIKVMDPQMAAQPSLRQRFLEEARIVSRLDHPNIVKVMSYNELRGELFMVMELITGGNLRRLLTDLGDRGRQMEIEDAVEMGVELATGLHYAHQQGLVHRDINPFNVMLKAQDVLGPIKDYTPILTDFSVSRIASPDAIYATDSDDSRTFPYLSPEQCAGERNDTRSDIYELGTTVYEMLTGRTPFQPRSLSEAVRMHTREPIPLPTAYRPDIPAEVEAVMLRSLEKNPNDRYQSAIDFARALQRALIQSGQETSGAGGALLPSAEPGTMVTRVMVDALPREMPSADTAARPR